MGKVIYLTGAPASGKSTALRRLHEKRPELLIWEYGERLAAHLNQRVKEAVSHEDLRARSSQVAHPDYIKELDQQLTEYVDANRSNHTIFINSHPVTKEIYGFRITPFSLDQFRRLAPNEVWVLYASPNATLERIKNQPAGRPTITLEEAAFHTMLQSSVASTYAASIGCPVYLFDTEVEPAFLMETMERRIA